jgi:hypothetical protein
MSRDYKELCREAAEAARNGDKAAEDWLTDQAIVVIYSDDDE